MVHQTVFCRARRKIKFSQYDFFPQNDIWGKRADLIVLKNSFFSLPDVFKEYACYLWSITVGKVSGVFANLSLVLE